MQFMYTQLINRMRNKKTNAKLESCNTNKPSRDRKNSRWNIGQFIPENKLCRKLFHKFRQLVKKIVFVISEISRGKRYYIENPYEDLLPFNMIMIDCN